MKRFYLILCILILSSGAWAQFQRNNLYFFTPGIHRLAQYDVLSQGTITYTNSVQDTITPVSMDFNHTTNTLYAITINGDIYSVSSNNIWSYVTQPTLSGDVVAMSFDLNGNSYFLDWDGAFGTFHIYKANADFSSATKLFSFTSPININAMVIDTNKTIYLIGSGHLYQVDVNKQQVIALADSSIYDDIRDAALDPSTNQIILVDNKCAFYYVNPENLIINNLVQTSPYNSNYNCVAMMPVDVVELTITTVDNNSQSLPEVKITGMSDFYTIFATTDNQGKLVRMVPPMNFNITAEKTGYTSPSSTLYLDKNTELVMQLNKLHNLELTFSDTAGNPLQNQNIYIYNYGQSSTQTLSTNNQGKVTTQLPSGIYRIYTLLDAYKDVSEIVTITSDTAFAFELIPYPLITFVVKDENGNPIEGTAIKYFINNTGTKEYPTNNQGTVKIPVTPGWWNFLAAKNGYGMQPISLYCDKDTTVNLTLKNGNYLYIATYKPDGNTGAKSFLYLDDTIKLSYGTTHELYFEPKTHHLKITSYDYLPVELDVDMSSDHYYSFTLQPAFQLRIKARYLTSDLSRSANDARIYIDGEYIGTGGYFTYNTTFEKHIVAAAIDEDSLWQEVTPVTDYAEVYLYLDKKFTVYTKVLSKNSVPVPDVNIFLDGEENLDFQIKTGADGIAVTQINLGIYNYTATYNDIIINGTLDYFHENDTNTIYLPLTLSDIQNQENQTTIYPNPASDYLIISGLNNGQIKITDMSGREIKHSQITTSSTKINIADLPHGIYNLTVINNNTIKRLKFIKQ